MLAKKYTRVPRQIIVAMTINVLIFILGPVLIALLTKNLSVEEYGAYSLLRTTITIGSVIFGFGLVQFIITKLSGIVKTKKMPSFFSLLVFEIIIAVFLILAVVFTPVSRVLMNVLKIGNYPVEFSLVVVIIAVQIVSNVFAGYFSSEKKLEFTNIMLFLTQGFWIVVLVAYFFITKKLSLSSVFIIFALIFLLKLLIYLFSARKEFAKYFRRKSLKTVYVKKALSFGVPLVLSIIGSYILVASDRYILTFLEGLKNVGIYSLAYGLISVPASVAIIIPKVLEPYNAEAWNRKQNYNIILNASIKYGFLFILPAIIGIFLLRKEVVLLISTSEYLSGINVMTILLLYPALTVLAYILTQIMMLKNETKKLVLIYSTAAVMNIILNIFLIMRYSITGAAIATIISHLFITVWLYLITKSDIRYMYKFLNIHKMIIASIIMCITVILSKNYLNIFVTIALSALIYFGVFYLIGGFGKEEKRIVLEKINIVYNMFRKNLRQK